MNLPRWVCKVTPILLAFLLVCTKSAAAADQGRAISVLTEEFETVFHAKADLLTGSGGYRRLPGPAANALRAPFVNLLWGLGALDPQASGEILRNADAVLVGAKDFRPPTGPTGLGAVQSRFCYLIVLRNQSTFELNGFASKFAGMFPAGASTWKWSARPTEGHPEPYALYATQVAGSYVLISNDVEALRATTTKLSSANNASSPLSGSRDWEHMSQHELWGYRRYQHYEGVNKAAAGTSEVMADAESLAFYVDLRQRRGLVRVHSSTGGTPDKMNKRRMLPPFRAVGSAVWQATIPLAEAQTVGERMHVVMGLFGFGVYL